MSAAGAMREGSVRGGGGAQPWWEKREEAMAALACDAAAPHAFTASRPDFWQPPLFRPPLRQPHLSDRPLSLGSYRAGPPARLIDRVASIETLTDGVSPLLAAESDAWRAQSLICQAASRKPHAATLEASRQPRGRALRISSHLACSAVPPLPQALAHRIGRRHVHHLGRTQLSRLPIPTRVRCVTRPMAATCSASRRRLVITSQMPPHSRQPNAAARSRSPPAHPLRSASRRLSACGVHIRRGELGRQEQHQRRQDPSRAAHLFRAERYHVPGD